MTRPSCGAPDLGRVVQVARGPVVDDLAGAVAAALDDIGAPGRIRPGDSVAITGGSRGIRGIGDVLRTTVERVRALGGDPFVVPAMGSHGGATAEGQRRVLASLGLTPETLGCEVRSSMEVVDLGPSPAGAALWSDALAQAADHLIVVNRVKPHTLFSGPVESGLAKMLAIGLGKHVGATAMHRAVDEHGWEAVLADVVPTLAVRTRLLGGIALVERSDDRTARVAGVRGDRILDDEPALLDRAREWMPRLPFPEVDILLVDQIGKDISGSGLDTNVVGRKARPDGHRGGDGPHVRHIVVRGLTPATGGNALGLGLADLCRSRVLRQADPATTRTNALTSGNLAAAKIPVDLPSDAEILDAALALIGQRPPSQARILWIRDTVHLDEVLASRALLAEVGGRSDLRVHGEPGPLPFDAHGNLPDHLPEA